MKSDFRISTFTGFMDLYYRRLQSIGTELETSFAIFAQRNSSNARFCDDGLFSDFFFGSETQRQRIRMDENIVHCVAPNMRTRI